jgi:hypothetical protein
MEWLPLRELMALSPYPRFKSFTELVAPINSFLLQPSLAYSILYQSCDNITHWGSWFNIMHMGVALQHSTILTLKASLSLLHPSILLLLYPSLAYYILCHGCGNIAHWGSWFNVWHNN